MLYTCSTAEVLLLLIAGGCVIYMKELKRIKSAIRKRNVACKCENDTKRNVSERNRKETPGFQYFQKGNETNSFLLFTIVIIIIIIAFILIFACRRSCFFL